jgi:hypothetical protein
MRRLMVAISVTLLAQPSYRTCASCSTSLCRCVLTLVYGCQPLGGHDPFKSEIGCMLFEMRYFDETRK